ncbi:MAG TPA: peptidoglycan-binding protein [Acidimicrobiales bacterium]|nr:peptidoglycan-binding protein [Acidimicrobiales bacterium]
MEEPLPLARGSTGEAVRDLQARLTAAGFAAGNDPPGAFADATDAAVRSFQDSRGLHVDGVCGRQTWSALVEAGYRLGDRLLYHRTPMLRGDDVSELQQALGALGFDAGRVDGFFGPNTANALKDFQQNVGVTCDGICGPDTLGSLRRLGGSGGRSAHGHPDQVPTEAQVREGERLRGAPRLLAGRRLVVGESGELGALADALGRRLQDAGAIVAVVHHPDGSTQAAEANGFGAEAFIGMGVLAEPGCAVSYYATRGFESIGGHRLAELALAEVKGIVDPDPVQPKSMRLPILRETRMPAILCEIGPPPVAVARGRELAEALAAAVTAWVEEPVGG